MLSFTRNIRVVASFQSFFMGKIAVTGKAREVNLSSFSDSADGRNQRSTNGLNNRIDFDFLNRIGRLVDTLKYWIPYSLPVDFFVYAEGLCTNRVLRRSMYGWHFPLYTAISARTSVRIVFNVVVLAKVS